MKNNIAEILCGKIVIVGIGNTLRGDDGFGPLLIQRLQGKIEAACIDAGTAPESYAGKILKENPDTILLVDAVHLDCAPGEHAVLNKNEILQSGLSTHDMSPKLFIEYLEEQSTADIYMLGVQPKNLAFGDEISDNVRKSLDEIEKLIVGAINA
jgi:hydrogenase 3 maturation protease